MTMEQKKRFLPILFTTIIFLAAAPSSARAQDDLPGLVRGTNGFACRMFSRLADGGGNIFFSPYSVSSALAMTYAGAHGTTAEQMAGVLGFTMPQDRLASAFSKLTTGLESGGGPVELHVANALWGQSGYPFAPAFLKTIAAAYGGGFKEVDYLGEAGREKARTAMNAWTAERTVDRIRDLIGPGILTADSRLVLTNAVYFKGEWAARFDPSSTRDLPFAVSPAEKTAVPMMRRKGKFGYAEDVGLQVLEMKYAGGGLSMVVLLPAPGSDTDKLRSALPEKLDGWLASLAEEKVDVFLPRFKLEQAFVLNGHLAALGMPDAFSEARADFSGMRPDGRKDLRISKVVHKAFVDVNEEGTEAAAATAVIMETKSISMGPVFRADRPFIFLIRDVRTGAILFMGRVSDPRSR